MLNKQTCVVKTQQQMVGTAKCRKTAKKKLQKSKWVLKIDECQIKQKGVKSHGFS